MRVQQVTLCVLIHNAWEIDADRLCPSPKALGALEKFVKLRLTSANSVEELLGTQLLGVLALMNDFLNDLHGRRSTAQKRKALNGLGKLIARVGVAISDVTPQVCHKENRWSFTETFFR